MIINQSTIEKVLTTKSISLTTDTIYVSLFGSSWNKVTLTGSLAQQALQNKRLAGLVFAADTAVFTGFTGSFQYVAIHNGTDLIGYQDVGLQTADNQDVTVDCSGMIRFALVS